MASYYQRPDSKQFSVSCYPRPGAKLVRASLGTDDSVLAEKVARKVDLLIELERMADVEVPEKILTAFEVLNARVRMGIPSPRDESRQINELNLPVNPKVDCSAKEAPDLLKQRDLSRALQKEIGEGSASNSSFVREDPPEYKTSRSTPPVTVDSILAEAACAMEDIIRKHAVVRWRENIDAQNRMRNDLDDFLFTLQTQKGVVMSYDQMDAIIEAVIRIAIHRIDDI